MASGNDFILSIPNQAVERQKASGDIQHRSRRLFWGTWVHNRDTAVMTGEGKHISTGREAHSMDPSGRVIQKFTTDGVERETLSPSTRLRTGINSLDVAREDSSVGVSRSGREQHRVRMPGKGSDGAPNRLLQVFRDPPVVLLFEIADRNHTGSRTNGKFRLGRGPSHESRSPVNSEKDQCWLPTRGSLFPDIGVTVWSDRLGHKTVLLNQNPLKSMLTLRASNNSSTVGRNINTSHNLLMTLQLIRQGVLAAPRPVELHIAVPRDSKRLPVGRERVVGNGIVKEMVNFRSGHVEGMRQEELSTVIQLLVAC